MILNWPDTVYYLLCNCCYVNTLLLLHYSHFVHQTIYTAFHLKYSDYIKKNYLHIIAISHYSVYKTLFFFQSLHPMQGNKANKIQGVTE